ncbi:MAG TPA: hypothetical protein VGB64_01950 [Actinomycetota bacterium]
MRTRIGAVLLATVAIAAPVHGNAAATLGALAGTGVSEFGECVPDSLQVTIQGTEVATGEWTFSAHAVNTDPLCQFPAIAVTFRGEWTPAGGCVPMIVTNAVIGDSFLCLTDPRPSGPLTDYDFTICDRDPCDRPEIPDFVSVFVTEA